MNTVVRRLHPLIGIKKDNNLGSRGKKNIKAFIVPEGQVCKAEGSWVGELVN